MEDIKERALKIFPVKEVEIPDIDYGCPSWLTEDVNATKRHCYIIGAKEQREIDINKALAFIQSLDEELSIASFADFASFKSETFINRLRKYMEEN